MAEVLLFAGPSASGMPLSCLSGVECRPPVRRGDIDSLLDEPRSRPGVLVICDGVFQSEPAVSHAELCRALDAGWQVWGVSSLGAIRAHEMRDEGMRGFGWVHAQFARHEDFADDEMCLLHLPAPTYTPVTEALVNLRYALQRRGAALGIDARRQRILVDWLRERWFGERSPELMLDLLVGPLGVPGPAAVALLDWMVAHRIKTLDLQRLLRERPWQRARRRRLAR